MFVKRNASKKNANRRLGLEILEGRNLLSAGGVSPALPVPEAPEGNVCLVSEVRNTFRLQRHVSCALCAIAILCMLCAYADSSSVFGYNDGVANVKQESSDELIGNTDKQVEGADAKTELKTSSKASPANAPDGFDISRYKVVKVIEPEPVLDDPTGLKKARIRDNEELCEFARLRYMSFKENGDESKADSAFVVYCILARDAQERILQLKARTSKGLEDLLKPAPVDPRAREILAEVRKAVMQENDSHPAADSCPFASFDEFLNFIDERHKIMDSRRSDLQSDPYADAVRLLHAVGNPKLLSALKVNPVFACYGETVYESHWTN